MLLVYINSVSVNTSELSLDVKARLAVTMFKDLVDIAHYQFDSDRLLRFSLTVAKNYRKEEYHNWDHAFSVAHCMYWILKGAPERFSDLEVYHILVHYTCIHPIANMMYTINVKLFRGLHYFGVVYAMI